MSSSRLMALLALLPAALHAGYTMAAVRLDGWVSIGPPGVNLQRLWIDPGVPAVAYISAGPYSFYRTTDGGATWDIPRGLEEVGVTGVLFDLAAEGVLYANASGPPFHSTLSLWRSNDGGASWESTGRAMMGAALAIDPSSPATMYAGSQGVWKTTDGGNSWSFIAPDTSQINWLVIDPRAPLRVFAGLNDGMIVTVDGGRTWVNKLADFIAPVTFDLETSDTVYAGTYGGEVHRSTDGGETWRLVSRVDGHIRALLVDARDPTTLYAGTANTRPRGTDLAQDVFKSTDRGASWEPTGLSAPIVELGLDAHTNTLYAGGSRGLHLSTDVGQTWEPANLKLTGLGGIVIDPLAPSKVYVVEGVNRILRRTTPGGRWTEIATGYPAHPVGPLAVDAVDPDTLYAGLGFSEDGASGGLLKSTDGGTTWTRVLPAAFVAGVDIAEGNSSLVWVAAGSVLKSANGGTSWVNTTGNVPLEESAVAVAVDPKNPDVVLYYTLGGSVLRTGDSGRTWRPVPAGQGFFTLPTGNIFAFDRDSPTVYAGMQKSEDGGLTWTVMADLPIGCDSPPAVTAIALVDASTLFVGTRCVRSTTTGAVGGDIFVTSDGGATWQAVGPGDLPVSDLALTRQGDLTLYAATSGFGAFQTSFSIETTSTTSSSTSTSFSSSISTTTSTSGTVPLPTTTLPCSPALCTDGDPCTVDSCTGDGCRHDDAGGLGAVSCVFQGDALQQPLCAGERVPGSITRALGLARARIDRALDQRRLRPARRLVKRAVRALKNARGAIGRAPGRQLSPDCTATLGEAIDDAIGRARLWLTEGGAARP